MRNFELSLSRRLSLALFAATLLVPTVTMAGSAVPFKASIAITELIHTVGTGACYLTGDISGTGEATHLGHVTLVSHDCINPINEIGTEFSFSSTQLVLTAANGDQIFATYSGTFTIQGPVGAIAGGYQIVGGTGRFSHATGAGTVQGLEDLTASPPKGQIQLSGTISY